MNPIHRPDGAPGMPMRAPRPASGALGPSANESTGLQGPTLPTDAGPAGTARGSRLSLEAGASAVTAAGWQPGQPLAEAHNAHRTNTVEEFEAALASGANWFEGDVRVELNEPLALEMRHDVGGEAGDNLTLEQWLARGKEAGVGLKLDIKEGQRMGEILDTVARSGVPDHRLMFNLGDGDMAKWAPTIRARFPGAILAVNPTDALGGRRNEGPLEAWQVERMIELAALAGPPVTFVVRTDRLTDEAIARLSQHGTISVWNDPGRGGVDDVNALTAELRRRGVDGMIDLRPSLSVVEKGLEALQWLQQQPRNWLGSGLQKAGSIGRSARDWLGGWL